MWKCCTLITTTTKILLKDVHIRIRWECATPTVHQRPPPLPLKRHCASRLLGFTYISASAIDRRFWVSTQVNSRYNLSDIPYKEGRYRLSLGNPAVSPSAGRVESIRHLAVNRRRRSPCGGGRKLQERDPALVHT